MSELGKKIAAIELQITNALSQGEIKELCVNLATQEVLLKQSLAALSTCTTGSGVDIDGDAYRWHNYDVALVSEATKNLTEFLK